MTATNFVGDASSWIPLLEQGQGSREVDREIGIALGWRVSRDPWWNWHPGPVFDPPGDEWCIRRDGRSDRPCNEALPHFTADILRAALSESQP